MRTTNTFGINFCIRKNKAKEGKAPIYARITVDGKRVEIAIKCYIEPKYWNGAKGFAKANLPWCKELNTKLEQYRSQIVDCYQELQLKKKLITAESVKALFCGTEEKEYSLINLIDYHNNELSGDLEKCTLGKYKTLKKYITDFLKDKRNTSDIYLTQLEYKFILDFELYLKNSKACGQNSAMKYLQRLRKMITIAIKNEWLVNDPFAKYKMSFTKSTRTFLDTEELKAIEAKQISISRLQHVQDLFIFSCYTGLAFIDMYNLSKENMTRGIDGEYWISTARKKTNEQVRVPLLPKALEIIEKYKDYPAVINNGKLLPSFSNQKLNAYLKELADLCSITKTLTFHMARHTFATTVTLTNGVPIETVSSMLGHSSIKTTQIYAKVIQHKVSFDMKALRDKMQIASSNETKLQSKAV